MVGLNEKLWTWDRHTMTMCVNIATRNTQNTGNTWDTFEKVIITCPCQGRDL